jgi:hypothetical protein
MLDSRKLCEMHFRPEQFHHFAVGRQNVFRKLTVIIFNDLREEWRLLLSDFPPVLDPTSAGVCH